MVNPLVEFNDSKLGIVLATSLHTMGAIAFLGGLVGYIAWHRHLAHQGHHHRKVLETSAFLTYIAIVANLTGGFMRTFESDHPGIEEFAASAWVRAIVIKHVFIFAGMAAAVYLFEFAAPRFLKAHKEGRLAEASLTGHRLAVVTASLGIIVAAVLGAITQVVPPVAASGDEDHLHSVSGSVSYHNATGQLTSTPAAAATATGSFQVPENTSQLQVTLLWSPTQVSLRLDLTDPNGDLHRSGDTPNGALTLTIDNALAGSWDFVIASELAFNVNWQLSARMASFAADETLLHDQAVIAPGQFFEINTVMDQGASFHWTWTTSSTVHFNVHSHFDDKVQDWVDEDAATGEGSFTNERKGGYSLLWENTGNLPVTLEYRVWGDFDLDSIFPPG